MKPCTWAFSSTQLSFSRPPLKTKFFPHFGKKTFWWDKRENTQPLFPLPLPTKPPLKIISPFFSTQFSILPIIPSNKHTLKGKKKKINRVGHKCVYIIIRSSKLIITCLTTSNGEALPIITLVRLD